jgi:hypothetical protein
MFDVLSAHAFIWNCETYLSYFKVGMGQEEP